MDCGKTAALAAAMDDRQHVTPQRRINVPVTAILVDWRSAFALDGDRKQPDLTLRQDTPPNALARDRCWWQISWLAGHCPWPPSQERYSFPVARLAVDSPLTVAGAAAALCAEAHAPRSLLIPCGNHR